MPPIRQTNVRATTTSRPAVDHPANSPDIAYGRRADFPANGVDEKFNRIALDLLVPAVDAALELAAGKNRARPAEESLQKSKLPGRQAAGLAVVVGLVGGWIEADRPIGEDRRAAAALPS